MCLYDVHTDKIIKLKSQVKELEAKVILSESQNYCKICGNTLDGYVPPKEKDENKRLNKIIEDIEDWGIVNFDESLLKLIKALKAGEGRV